MQVIIGKTDQDESLLLNILKEYVIENCIIELIYQMVIINLHIKIE